MNAPPSNWAAGRVAFVTGATSGMGRAVALTLLSGGARVIATGRRLERLQQLQAEVASGLLLTRELDVRSLASLQDCLASLPQEFQAVDTLINNAGLALGLNKAHEASLEDWESMIQTNVTGLTRVTRAILPGMVARNRGDIINLSSVAATYPYPGGNVYGATKAFVRQLSLNLRADLLGTPLRVSSVEIGLCDTEFSLVRFKGNAAAADATYAGMRPLLAEDVARVIESILRLPAHVNVNSIEVMPVQQAFAGFAVDRNSGR
ncbi:MAG TPA: SDR family NAD(P)-dependent oxidoreductase [Steroidobacteraceae bacterium]